MTGDEFRYWWLLQVQIPSNISVLNPKQNFYTSTFKAQGTSQMEEQKEPEDTEWGNKVL